MKGEKRRKRDKCCTRCKKVARGAKKKEMRLYRGCETLELEEEKSRPAARDAS